MGKKEKQKVNINKNSLKRVLKYSARYKFRFLTVVILSLIVGATSAAPAFLIKKLQDDVFVAKDYKALTFIVIAIVGAAALKGIAMYYRQIMSSYATRLVVRDIQGDIYKHLNKLSHSYYDRVPQGEIMSRLSGDASSLGSIGFMVFQMLPKVLTIVILVIKLFTVNLTLALITLFVVPILVGLLKKIMKKVKKTARKRQDIRGELNSLLQESLAGVRVVKAFATEEEEIKRYQDKNMDVLNTEYRNQKVAARISPINEVVMTSMIAMILLYGGRQTIVDPNFTSGDLFAFITALGLTFQPLKDIIKRFAELVSLLPSVDRVLEVLDETPEVVEKEDALEYGELTPTVRFNNVSFSYNKDTDLILKNVDLEAKKGEVVALVGRSGSGKTTMVNLIPRFYELDGGNITIDGTDIKDLKVKALRDHIGIVPQETFLFSGTILSNIMYGSKEGTTENQAVEAAKKANAHNFIVELDNGYEQEVGERGTLLSGGQKQRIAIARALLKNPEIMILDEATSALDTESERLVQDALETLMEGRTTFVIAHRLSTIVNANKIVVMDKGEIIEEGSHTKLLEKGGVYKKLYETQFGEEEQE